MAVNDTCGKSQDQTKGHHKDDYKTDMFVTEMLTITDFAKKYHPGISDNSK